MSATKRRSYPQAVAACAWCGERKPLALLRHPSSSRGKTPTTCHACREAHPDESWCDHHKKPHPRSAFPTTKRPIGLLNICDDAAAYLAASRRDKPSRICPSCDVEQESWFFRGGRQKAHACRGCEARNPGRRWCIDCATWLPEARFNRSGLAGKFWEARCKPCATANDHGVTRAFLAELTGSETPSCGACGATDSLKIDHSHEHCRSARGCRECVRGYLCHACNTSEGLLQTSARVLMLAKYMERHGL